MLEHAGDAEIRSDVFDLLDKFHIWPCPYRNVRASWIVEGLGAVVHLELPSRNSIGECSQRPFSALPHL